MARVCVVLQKSLHGVELVPNMEPGNVDKRSEVVQHLQAFLKDKRGNVK